MTLNERIVQDMKVAMKSGQTLRLSTLRTLRAQMLELAKRGTDSPITAEDETAVLLSAVKKRKEAIELYEKAGRMELAAKEREELTIINSYLPQQLSRDELLAKIDEIIASTGSTSAKDFGKVMGATMKELKGRADGSLIQELVKHKLGA
jgi:uncharacterized protein